MKIKKIRILKGFLIFFFIFSCKIKIFAKTDSLIEKKKVAVFDMAANNVPGYYGNIVRNSLEIALFNSDKFQLLDRQQVEEISKKLNISSKSNNNPSDMVRLGKRLQADFIINGSIDKLDDYKITLRVISISGGSIITAYSRFFSKANDIDYAVERLNEKIVRDIHKYIKDGRVRSRFFEHNNMYLGVRGNYIYPINELEFIINPGPGVTFFYRI